MVHPSYPADGVCRPDALPPDLIQVMNAAGELVGEPLIDDQELLGLYRHMLRQRLMDDRCLTLQRQGRIGFYGACTGQEACVFGAAAGVQDTDWVVPALREAGILLYRGLPMATFFNQLLGNSKDITLGHQMPCHPPGGGFHYITMSSVIANHIPQSNGLALAGKLRKDGRVTLCFMGDGATSEGDFHVGLNVAAVQKLPVVFFCQNNQWSISVPIGGQTAAKTLVSRAKGYGMPGVRVDGNDVLAVQRVTKEAADRARSGGGPTFIEALTYRLGAHTTSDDPSRYRDESVTDEWWAVEPLTRVRRYLERKGLWSDADQESVDQEVDRDIRSTWKQVEDIPPPALRSIFESTFAELTPQLQEQYEGLVRNQEWAAKKGHVRKRGH
jgi:pyruvate dehydrogenase E1 component alpha subunit/2-oxoisovalerate dehydrogenase E1 component alpha subunit